MENVEFLLYLMKVSLILGIFYGVYHLLMRNRPSHSWNRGYLLGTLLLALVIPLLENPLPDRPNVLVEEDVLAWMAEPVLLIKKADDTAHTPGQHVGLLSVVLWTYGAVVLLLTGRSFLHLVILHQLKKQSIYVTEKGFKLYKTAHAIPFSFMSNVFIPRQLFGAEAFDQILMHECAHVRQLHSLDRLLVDFYVALFWFNPFIYLYRRALIEVHEFQADKAVIEVFRDPLGYQEVLFEQLRLPGYSGLVSHFNFSIIKKRIVMMNKTNNKPSGWYYLVALPVILSVIFAFSSKEAKRHLSWVEGEISVMVSPEIPQLSVPDTEPSIMPVEFKETKVRMSSGFGKRLDPISKEERYHFGVDFAAPMGTPVIATADGKVVEVKTSSGGYGKRIVVEHGKYTTRYAQLSVFKVTEGQVVKKGDVIGLVGSSGRSTAPHLHYEILKDGKRVNPADYIQDYEFQIKKKEDKE